MRRLGLNLLLGVLLLPPAMWVISKLSGHDYMTLRWFLALVVAMTVIDVAVFLWKRRHRS